MKNKTRIYIPVLEITVSPGPLYQDQAHEVDIQDAANSNRVAVPRGYLLLAIEQDKEHKHVWNRIWRAPCDCEIKIRVAAGDKKLALAKAIAIWRGWNFVDIQETDDHSPILWPGDVLESRGYAYKFKLGEPSCYKTFRLEGDGVHARVWQAGLNFMQKEPGITLIQVRNCTGEPFELKEATCAAKSAKR